MKIPNEKLPHVLAYFFLVSVIFFSANIVASGFVGNDVSPDLASILSDPSSIVATVKSAIKSVAVKSVAKKSSATSAVVTVSATTSQKLFNVQTIKRNSGPDYIKVASKTVSISKDSAAHYYLTGGPNANTKYLADCVTRLNNAWLVSTGCYAYPNSELGKLIQNTVSHVGNKGTVQEVTQFINNGSNTFDIYSYGAGTGGYGWTDIYLTIVGGTSVPGPTPTSTPPVSTSTPPVTPTSPTVTHTINASVPGNLGGAMTGIITPNGTTNVPDSTNQTYHIIPSSGYHISGVWVDTSSVGATSTYVFTNVTSNHLIQAYFDVTAGPTITLSANPSLITAGGTSTLSWSTTGLDSSTGGNCGFQGYPVPSTGGAISGSVGTGPLTATTKFTLLCSNGSSSGGVMHASTTVVVHAVPACPDAVRNKIKGLSHSGFFGLGGKCSVATTALKGDLIRWLSACAPSGTNTSSLLSCKAKPDDIPPSANTLAVIKGIVDQFSKATGLKTAETACLNKSVVNGDIEFNVNSLNMKWGGFLGAGCGLNYKVTAQ